MFFTTVDGQRGRQPTPAKEATQLISSQLILQFATENSAHRVVLPSCSCSLLSLSQSLSFSSSLSLLLPNCRQWKTQSLHFPYAKTDGTGGNYKVRQWKALHKEGRKEGRKAGRQAGRKRGREGGAAAIWWRSNGVANTTVDAGCNAAERWERTRESKQTELLANEAEGKGEEEQDKEKQVKLGFCLYLSWETLPFPCGAHIPPPLSYLGFALLRPTTSDDEMKKIK